MTYIMKPLSLQVSPQRTDIHTREEEKHVN